MKLSRIAVIGMLALLSACASSPEGKTRASADGGPADIYARGQKQLENNNYELAIQHFDTLESRFPFGPYAQQAALESAYAHYKLREPDIAIAKADDFVKLNPTHEDVDYAYYIKGLANFDRFNGLFDSIAPRDFSELDPNPIKQAFIDFKQLLLNYPSSKYAIDAEKRLVYLKNLLAKHELNIARYYAKRGAPVAVVNRCKFLIENYDGADSIPDALVEMGKAYKKLQLDDAYLDTLRVLELNYPHQVKRLKES